MAALVQVVSRDIDSLHWGGCSSGPKSEDDMVVLELEVLLGDNFEEGTAGFALNGEDNHYREVAAEDGMDIEKEPVDGRTFSIV